MPPPLTRNTAQNLRVVRYAPGWGYAASEWASALGGVDWSTPHAEGGPERLKLKTLPSGDKDCTVWRATLVFGAGPRQRAHEVVIKVDPLDTPKKKLQALVRRTKAFRQWRGAALLERAGVRTAQPLAVLRGRSALGPCEMLVLASLPGRTLLEWAASPDLGVRDQHALAAEVGAWTRSLWQRDLFNRDHKPSNIVVYDLGEGRLACSLVDTVDVRRVAPLPLPWLGTETALEAMLAKLWIECAGCGLAPRRALTARVCLAAAHGGSKTARKQLWRDVYAIVRSHGDPRPKDDPLARG